MHITLRPGERLYLNGAVLRADRKVSLELMNDATFILEAHVMHADKAKTPTRQLYFIVQMMLMDPRDTTVPRSLFDEMVARMLTTYEDDSVRVALTKAIQLVAATRYFDALKILRAVFDRDDALMSPAPLALAS